jgi:hypothetical protein
MTVVGFSIQELIPPTDNPQLFVQEDPKHTCQVTHSSNVTGVKFSTPSFILVGPSLYTPVQPLTDRYSAPRPGPAGEVPWDCGSAGCSHTVKKLDTGVHEKIHLRQPNRDMESPRTTSTPTGYEGRLMFVQVSHRISEFFCRQVFALCSMN